MSTTSIDDFVCAIIKQEPIFGDENSKADLCYNAEYIANGTEVQSIKSGNFKKQIPIQYYLFNRDDLKVLQIDKLNKSNSNFPCSVCGKILLHKKSLRSHLKNHEKPLPYKCHICDATLKKQETYDAHIKLHNGINPHGCEICGVTFSTRGNLLTHQAIHAKTRRTRERFVCEICGKNVEARAYNVHMRIHSGEKPYECHICNARFNFESNLKRHICRVHNNSNAKGFKCEISDKTIKTQRLLNSHKPEHTGEFRVQHSTRPKSFLCHFCGKKLLTKSAAQVHMRNHFGLKPYKCLICDKKFASSTYLMFHMRIHDGYKPYKCTHCTKSFAHKHVLVNHIRTHTGEKPFGCHLCNKHFAQNITLTSHLKSHAVALEVQE